LVYAQTLLTKNAKLWVALLIVWFLVAVTIGIVSKFDLPTFLLVVALPTLPPFMDAVDEWLRIRTAGKQRRAIANEIQDAVSNYTTVPPDYLLTWQSQLFALRRDSPLVPDWLYRLLRSRTEDEMAEGARFIAAQTRSRKDEDECLSPRVKHLTRFYKRSRPPRTNARASFLAVRSRSMRSSRPSSLQLQICRTHAASSWGLPRKTRLFARWTTLMYWLCLATSTMRGTNIGMTPTRLSTGFAMPTAER